MERPEGQGRSADERPAHDEDVRNVRRRGPVVDRRVLGWVGVATLVIGGSVGAMHTLSDPMVYEVTERVKEDDQALRELVASAETETPEYLVAENDVSEAAATAGALGALADDPYDRDVALGNDPMSALGAMMGDEIGQSYGFGGLGLSGAGRGGGGTGYGTIGTTGPIGDDAVLQNSFLSGNGVRARLEHLLERGMNIDGERVRIGAFTDRHSLPYPVPTDRAVALHAELERPRLVSAGDTVHLSVALVGRRGEQPRRPRMDVRLVLDVSGSMTGDKIAHALIAAGRLVDRLRPNDGLGIITYESSARMVLAPQRVGDGSRARRALRQIEAGGGTNIEAGLRLAVAHPPERPRASDVGLVILLSDGEATDGITAPGELGRIARSLYDERGVLTTTIGLGTSFSEETMLTIAREGSGSYHFVRRPEDIRDVLTDELDERAQAVAQALRVRVELAPGVEATKVYGTRVLTEKERDRDRATELATDARIAEELGIVEDRADEEGGIRMHLPTFRRGDDHVILFELRVPPGTAGRGLEVARVFLDYKDLVDETNGAEESVVRATWIEGRREAIASTRREVKRTVLSFQAAEALATASQQLREGRREQALITLSERCEVLRAGAELWSDAQLRRDAELLDRYVWVIRGPFRRFGYDDRDTLLTAMSTFADRRMR